MFDVDEILNSLRADKKLSLKKRCYPIKLLYAGLCVKGIICNYS